MISVCSGSPTTASACSSIGAFTPSLRAASGCAPRKRFYIPFFNEFNPKDFDPKKWARLAKQAGMKYAVLTAKHHDGFCLFDSALTDWKVTNTPYGKDIVREYLDAFRAEGIKVGL